MKTSYITAQECLLGEKYVLFKGRCDIVLNMTSIIFLLQGKCGTISIPFCQNMSYTTAQFPNHLNQNQEDAKAWIDAKDLTKLVQSGCSPDIGPLLCSFLAPPCNGPGRLVKPCKQLCKRATKACKAVLRRLRINLHPVMACRQLPRDRTPKCFDGSWKGDTSGIYEPSSGY